MTEVASSTAPPEGAMITWYLDYQGAPLSLPDWPVGVSLTEAEIASPELSQFLFCAVGQHWRWYSRLSWDYAQLAGVFKVKGRQNLGVVSAWNPRRFCRVGARIWSRQRGDPVLN